MTVALPTLRVGDPLRHESLTVFPLFTDLLSDVEYRLSDEAMANQSVLVEETSHGGSVPDLLVENKSDVRVLFLEGEELIGAKQNRILNTSLLVAARSKIKVPVSCEELSERYLVLAAVGVPSAAALLARRTSWEKSVTQRTQRSDRHHPSALSAALLETSCPGDRFSDNRSCLEWSS